MLDWKEIASYTNVHSDFFCMFFLSLSLFQWKLLVNLIMFAHCEDPINHFMTIALDGGKPFKVYSRKKVKTYVNFK